MLEKLRIIEVDELYLNVTADGAVSRIGVNNGIIVDPEWAPPVALVPRGSVRVLNSKFNLPLVLAAGAAYERPVEVAPVTTFARNGEGMFDLRDCIIESRNRHRAFPEGHPLGYRELTDVDLYAYGHTYNVFTKQLGFPTYKFSEDALDFTINLKYIDGASMNHAMSDAFAYKHVSTVCGILGDPRTLIGPTGAFEYSVLPDMLGGSLVSGCTIARHLIQSHGPTLPEGVVELEKLVRKYSPDVDTLLGGIRIIHDILSTSLDDLGVTLRGKLSRATKDGEMVRQRLHWIINTWLQRIYGDDWTVDPYDPSLFDILEEDD